jgi:hypothetical protein
MMTMMTPCGKPMSWCPCRTCHKALEAEVKRLGLRLAIAGSILASLAAGRPGEVPRLREMAREYLAAAEGGVAS